ncbi:MAG: hypothetical protein LBJ71_03925, partial [Holosporaceae bacterium]|nr:hypothetical protein [Holosporaceae bacterium]
KALRYIEDESLAPAIVFGIDGGYVDHVLGNISIFSRTEFAAISKDIIFLAVEGNRSFHVEINTKISIFGMPHCIIKSKGLKWELNDHELSIGGMNSSSNRATSNVVELELSEGRALVFIYTKNILDKGMLSKNSGETNDCAAVVRESF